MIIVTPDKLIENPIIGMYNDNSYTTATGTLYNVYELSGESQSDISFSNIQLYNDNDKHYIYSSNNIFQYAIQCFDFSIKNKYTNEHGANHYKMTEVGQKNIRLIFPKNNILSLQSFKSGTSTGTRTSYYNVNAYNYYQQTYYNLINYYKSIYDSVRNDFTVLMKDKLLERQYPASADITTQQETNDFFFMEMTINDDVVETISGVDIDCFSVDIKVPYTYASEWQSIMETYAGSNVRYRTVFYANQFIPETISLTFGTKSIISEQNSGSNAYSVSDKGNIYEFKTNELMQNNSEIIIDEDSGWKYNYFDYIADKITSAYNNGLQTVKLKLKLTEYCDENGDIIINPANGESIKNGDILKIYQGNIYNLQPLSTYSDASVRYFQVVNTNVIYDNGVSRIECEAKEYILPDGIYDASGNLISSYNQMVRDGNLTVVNKVVTASSRIEGNLILENSDIISFGTASMFGRTGLKSITLPKTIQSIGVSAFASCSSLENVVFTGDKLTSIDGSAFTNCLSLETIVLPDSLESVGNLCFDNCNNIKNISFGSNISYIGQMIMSYYIDDCIIDFTRVNQIPTLHQDGLFHGGEPDTPYSIIVPDELYSQWVVASVWSQYASHIYPESYLTAGLFDYDTGSRLYSWKELVDNGYITVSGNSITGRSFPSGTSNVKLVMPANITSISSYVFNSTSSLRSVDMPYVKTIGANAFRGCYQIRELNLPRVETIGDGAFYNLAWIEYVDLSSCKSFGYGIFEASYRLKVIKFRDIELFGQALFGSYTHYIPEGAYFLEYLDMTECSAVPDYDDPYGTTVYIGELVASANTYKIVVSDSLYNSWITSSVWAGLSSHIIKQSDFEANN